MTTVGRPDQLAQVRGEAGGNEQKYKPRATTSPSESPTPDTCAPEVRDARGGFGPPINARSRWIQRDATINSVREDVISRSETFQCLGLSLVANVGGREFADSLAADVQRVLCSNVIRPIVRKKAALALLRLYRRNRDILTPETFSQRMLDLLDERDLGILTGVLSLLTGIVAHDHRGYESCIPKICEVMQLARNKDIPMDYLYYQLPSPWVAGEVHARAAVLPHPRGSRLPSR